MKAIDVTGPGGPENLVVAEVPSPVPGPGEVLIEVTAAGVNRADLLQRQGFYPPPPGASSILGLECSGTVVEPGGASSPWPPGDQVCALLSGGGYAQQVVVPIGQVMPLPEGIDLISAASFPEVAATVYSNLHDVARVAPGEWLLVHGGGSGIGTFAIQWASALGVRVIVTVGSDIKAQKCLELGAEVAINYREEDFAERVREVTAGRGVDVILDTIGAKYLTSNIASLATGGRMVVIGLQGGVRGELDLAALLRCRGSIAATSLRARPAQEKAAICQGLVRDVWPMIADGRIQPVIDQVLPWQEAARAHEVLEASNHIGKVLLNFRSGVTHLE